MTGGRPDLFDGLGSRQRLKAERRAVIYLRDHLPIYANAEAMTVATMLYAATDILRPSDLLPLAPDTAIDAVICARLDLDHPLYFKDNVVARCGDCGCDIQVRPHTPLGPRFCIMCAERRAREQKSFFA